MRFRKTILLSFLFFLYAAAFFSPASFAEEKNPVTIYFFWGDGCPHCAKEEVFLDSLASKYPNVSIRDFEVWRDRENQKLFQKVGRALSADVSGVPFTVIGEKYIPGYLSDETTGREIERLVQFFSDNDFTDRVAALISPEQTDKETSSPVSSKIGLGEIWIPIIGNINTETLSLPAFTILIGLLDGFNPCAMWVLIFLISFLIGIENKTRRWVLGSVFIFVSGFVYFLFMAAWLNLLLFIGFVFWVRVVIGVLAITGGGYNIKEFFKNKANVCKTAGEEKKKKIIERMKNAVQRKNILFAAVGISVLAFGVNLVELFCSAGFPAVYTQVLAINNLSTISYYLYLVLYVLFFILDDFIVFIIAMKTLEITGITSKYTKASHLIGGVLMLIIGILLIFKPNLLMFG